MNCEHCGAVPITDMLTYRALAQTEYGLLCNVCRAANMEDIKDYGAANHISQALLYERGEQNARDFARMIRDAWPSTRQQEAH